MHRWLKKGLDTVKSAADKAVTELTDTYTVVKDKVDGLPIVVSAEKSEKYQGQQFDEKHYFVIPFALSDYRFALHTMRCLPNGVPEVNDLPKRRIFHFPNEHAETMLQEQLRLAAQDKVTEQEKDNLSSLESLANKIDSIDQKLTYGMLLVGGLTALVNPLLGAGLAAKALLPNMGTLLTKYGLKPIGEKLTQHQLEQSVKEAETKVAQEFESANTTQVINPILASLERSLQTTDTEYDPLLDFDIAECALFELQGERWRELTERAICHVYQEVYDDPSLHSQANLGEAELRWLGMLYEVNQK